MSGLKALLAVLVLALGSSCAALPEDGPVQIGSERAPADLDEGIPFAPRPPQRGETAREIVRHFLDAMMANPVQTSTARQFLSESAREAWSPEERIITYSGPVTPTGQYTVDVELVDAHWLDARGRWQGSLPAADSRLSLPMAREDGEWRIAQVPDALIVHDSWFQERYRQVSLHFFDPTAEILVPEPVFVPRGGQLATSLVRGLLQGPPDQAAAGTATFFPQGSALADVSVPVSEDGVAEVALRGDLASLGPESLDLMTAQMAWTLRQDPTVKTVRMTFDGTPVTLPGGITEFPVTLGERFDPVGIDASADLFALRGGQLVRVIEGELVPVDGPFGASAYSLDEVSLDVGGDVVSAITGGGTTLLTGPVSDDPDQTVRTLVRGARSLAHPAWDASGNLWLLDRRPGGAVVSVVVDGVRREVVVRGVTGEPVVDFLVSRDGSRLVAALDRPDGDEVVVSRLRWSATGVAASPARTIERIDNRQSAVRDLAWRSSTEILVLNSQTSRLSEARTVSVDGAPASHRGVSPPELLREDGRRLVASPLPGLPAWVVTATGVAVQLAPITQGEPPPDGLSALTFAG